MKNMIFGIVFILVAVVCLATGWDFVIWIYGAGLLLYVIWMMISHYLKAKKEKEEPAMRIVFPNSPLRHKYKCPKCGVRFEEDVMQCPYCGLKFGGTVEKEEILG